MVVSARIAAFGVWRGPRNDDRSVVGIRMADADLVGKRDKRQKRGSENNDAGATSSRI
jgi:hypothetical protein